MRTKTALEKLKPILRAPSFTSKDANRCGVSAATLAYYVKQNELIRLGHGIYRAAKLQAVSDFRWEELLEVMQRVKDGVICLTSALIYYKLTEGNAISALR